jgi:hypothetical protein
MTAKTRHLLAAAAVVGSIVALSMVLTTKEAVAQIVLRACYVPNTGIVYRIAVAGAPDECRSSRHVEFSWTDGGGGVSDHGALTGLADDDHTQYVLADGVRGTTDGFAVTGALFTGSIPVEGGGTRLMWYPGKNAFRVGSVSGTQWDEANIGGSSVAMGSSTTASGGGSFAMGFLTTASGTRSTAMGEGTTAGPGAQSTAMGSFTTASGQSSTAMGSGTIASGQSSTAMGQQTEASAFVSTAMGRRASTNGMAGSFVYGDNSINAVLLAPAVNSFTVRAAGGTTFYSNSLLTSGVSLAPGGGSWSSVSDRNRKADFRTEDGEAVLEKIAALPSQSWSYKAQAPSIRHMGPTAQDFYAAFGLGEGELTITTTDIDGVNLLAVQALEKRTADLRAENEMLRTHLAELEAVVRSLLISE